MISELTSLLCSNDERETQQIQLRNGKDPVKCLIEQKNISIMSMLFDKYSPLFEISKYLSTQTKFFYVDCQKQFLLTSK